MIVLENGFRISEGGLTLESLPERERALNRLNRRNVIDEEQLYTFR